MSLLKKIAGSSLARRASFKYTTITTGDKTRRIAVPNAAMRKIHTNLLRKFQNELLAGSGVYRSSYGVLSGRSAVENATLHLPNRYVYQLDISSAFPSTSLERLSFTMARQNPRLGTVEEIRHFLETFCKGESGGLAVGAPLSPALFDFYLAHALDPVIRALLLHQDAVGEAWQARGVYTRYLDDLTISSNEPIPTILRKRIRTLVERAGFSVNHRKSVVTDRLTRSVTITGVVLTKECAVRPTDEFLTKTRMALKSLTVGDEPASHAQLAGLYGHMISVAGSQHFEIPSDVLRLMRKLEKKVLIQKSGDDEQPPRRTAARLSERYIIELLYRVPILSVVDRYFKDNGITMKPVGALEYKTCCPFHNEKTPSFFVSTKKGFYHCFGCGVHGDSIRFVMEMYELPFRKAVQYLEEHFPFDRSE